MKNNAVISCNYLLIKLFMTSKMSLGNAVFDSQCFWPISEFMANSKTYSHINDNVWHWWQLQTVWITLDHFHVARCQIFAIIWRIVPNTHARDFPTLRRREMKRKLNICRYFYNFCLYLSIYHCLCAWTIFVMSLKIKNGK